MEAFGAGKAKETLHKLQDNLETLPSYLSYLHRSNFLYAAVFLALGCLHFYLKSGGR